MTPYKKFKPWFTFAAAGLFVLGGAMPAHAGGPAGSGGATIARTGEGTGVGGGDGAGEALGYERTANLPQLKIEAERYDGRAQASIDQWCDGVLQYLGKQHGDALSQIQDQNIGLALRTLRRAMDDALKSLTLNPKLAPPLTRKMLERGKALDEALSKVVGARKRGTYLQAQFLASYLGFVNETIGELDRPYYVPYIVNGYEIMAGIAERYLQFAHDQLAYVNGRFSSRVERDGTYTRVPRDQWRVYLTLAAMFSKYVADDLEQTKIAHANACSIAKLHATHDQLIAYLNHGNDPELRDPLFAVDKIARRLKHIDYHLTGSTCDLDYELDHDL